MQCITRMSCLNYYATIIIHRQTQPCTGLKSRSNPDRCFLGRPIFFLKFSRPACFRPAKVKAWPGATRLVNEMNAHYKQFFSFFWKTCFLPKHRNLFHAKTSKLEIATVVISLYRNEQQSCKT